MKGEYIMNHADERKEITGQTEKILIDQYERFYRLAYSYVHNEADALDVVQESACKAITQCKNLKDTEKLLPWLCRIVVNTSLDLLRSQVKEQPTEELPETETVDKYEEFDLKEALNRLEPKNCTIIILRYFEDMKIEDIALVVDENVNTVKARLYRSLKKLRVQLDGTATL
jgi:RNA polymerase sigma-70 factor, ECF subfamily